MVDGCLRHKILYCDVCDCGKQDKRKTSIENDWNNITPLFCYVFVFSIIHQKPPSTVFNQHTLESKEKIGSGKTHFQS